jgi:hypothetical protein
MSVSVPQPFVSNVNVAQPFRSKLEGIPSIPTSYTYGVTEIPPVSVAVTDIPQVDYAVKELPVIRLSVDNVAPIHYSVDPIEIKLTEVPSVRTHLPADFAVSFSMLGVDFGTIRLCGEAQIITEPYRPNPCETCGPTISRQVDTPQVNPRQQTDSILTNVPR